MTSTIVIDCGEDFVGSDEEGEVKSEDETEATEAEANLHPRINFFLSGNIR